MNLHNLDRQPFCYLSVGKTAPLLHLSMTSKKCRMCHLEKTTDNFPKQRCICKVCTSKYMKQWRISNRFRKHTYNRTRKDKLLQVVNEYKSERKCAYCGEADHCCLDFHHLDPSKKDLTVNELVKKSNTQRLLKEFSKCEIVCANCHRKLHAGRSLSLCCDKDSD